MISVYISPELKARFLKLKATYPKIAYKSWNGVTLKAKNQLASSVDAGGGKYGVPVWSPLARMTRALTWRKQPGGVLGKKSSIVRYFQGKGVQIIGWPDKLDEFSEAFQTDETRSFTPRETKALPRSMGKMGVYPQTIREIMAEQYSRPARNTVAPAVEHMNTWMAPEFMKRADRAMAKELKAS